MIKAKKIPIENDFGNCEYKVNISRVHKKKLYKLAAQLKFRLYEGEGKAYYFLGFHDNGVPIGIFMKDFIQSLLTFCDMIELLDVIITKIKFYKGIIGYCCCIHIIE